MPSAYLILAILALGCAAFALASRRARNSAEGNTRALHSRTHYHGAFVLLLTVLPALILVGIWKAAEGPVIESAVWSGLAAHSEQKDSGGLAMTTVRMLADGLTKLSQAEIDEARAEKSDLSALLATKGVALAAKPDSATLEAALHENSLRATSNLAMTIAALCLALAGLTLGLSRIDRRFRSRNAVERIMLVGLMACSLVAILTTIGIVLSMLFETLKFFDLVPLSNFFFGTVWDPRFSAAGKEGGGQGQFGLLPLLWGTLYISAVALLVAVPAGLFSAIYMSEYASPRVRMTTKPLLEILAGIPTIVYGFFALVTLGPFLRDAGASIGLSISASSVLSAGLIMGVMLIPFVSSLADDILNAVPQSLREGSYGLGATQSETIKRVVLPAALPGIMGAILLAASRAIGETMIVVLAAGIAANLTLNPFEPVTTITVKIVSQLTGDLEFNSPQTLVAFALGLTLFVFTLALNVYALYIVRKYREQYE